MLGLKLRQEFQGRRLKGTAIELTNASNTGATQVPAVEFLDITYPSRDVLQAIEAIGPDRGRPAVLIGERGQGKSHIIGVLYHALSDSAATASWLQEWAGRLANPKVATLPLRQGVHVITESLHRQSYKFLWDLLFDRHPHGEFIRGKWDGLGDKQTEVPSYELLLELFRKQPTALILDEYQTWFDGLTNTKQYPWRNWAFNFIQLLSEIAKERPELLTLVVSVRNGTTDAFQQIQRVNPVLVDFKAPNARSDRQRLLLHRLFENRLQVPDGEIRRVLRFHVSEHLRLQDVALSEQDRTWQEFVEAWPYAPHLMQLLEDQVLVATQAQETRDLIRILVDLYKRRGDDTPIITAADFRLDDEQSGIAALLDSVANQHHARLREKAQRNFSAVRDAVKNPDEVVPHLSEIVGALWVRSLAVGNQAGANPATLQVDITRDKPVDNNGFEVELATIVDNSFNIHPEGERLIFREEENPRAKLMANARNDRLFAQGEDETQLSREIRYVLGGSEDVAQHFRVVVLPKNWVSDPWAGVEEGDLPERWDDRIPLVVLPEVPDKLETRLGAWLKEHLQRRRNTVRFLLPQDGSNNAFADHELLVLARAVLLAERWQGDDPEYRKLHHKYEGELRAIIKRRFDRFAILDVWDFSDPARGAFHVVRHKAQGAVIPDAVDKYIHENLFIPEDFEALVVTAAGNNDTVAKLLRELQEPRPKGQPCIPWLGETLVKEKLIRLCARDRIAINLRGMEYLQVLEGEEEEAAWRHMRGRLGTGKHLEETHVLLPQAVPQVGDVAGHPPAAFPLGDGSTPVPAAAPPASGGKPGDGPQDTGDVPGGQSIFAGGTTFTSYNAPATSPLNLLGQAERWGINAGTRVRDLSITVGDLTGAQLTRLLRSLPDGITYEMGLHKEED